MCRPDVLLLSCGICCDGDEAAAGLPGTQPEESKGHYPDSRVGSKPGPRLARKESGHLLSLRSGAEGSKTLSQLAVGVDSRPLAAFLTCDLRRSPSVPPIPGGPFKF